MGLVRPILLKRINNEIDNLNEYLELTIGNIPDSVEFPIILSIYLSNAPARASRDAEIRRHRFDLVISSDYPFERPRAKWKTTRTTTPKKSIEISESLVRNSMRTSFRNMAHISFIRTC